MLKVRYHPLKVALTSAKNVLFRINSVVYLDKKRTVRAYLNKEHGSAARIGDSLTCPMVWLPETV